MKNITLSAPEEVIEQARQQAAARGTTLNQEFRQWLSSQASSGEQQAQRYQQLIKRWRHINAGRPFTRAEMNER